MKGEGAVTIKTHKVVNVKGLGEIQILRRGQTGEGLKRIVIQKGDRTYDITEKRVKEYIKNPESIYGDEVKFKKYGVPEGSETIKGPKSGKGHKRTPTAAELELLNHENN